jgi:predicted dehydrogenase
MTKAAKDKVRWGVIGCEGIAAGRILPEFVGMASSAEIDSVMDLDSARAAQVAARFSVPHHSTTEAELLARDIDAVYIATPPDCHCRQVVQAAQAGKHTEPAVGINEGRHSVAVTLAAY